ncbi:MAG: hypothetical protein NTV94_15990, partial [Planctomycetota bacterium]|nr:hypothetical protein [Planctomycetota bacterium]
MRESSTSCTARSGRLIAVCAGLASLGVALPVLAHDEVTVARNAAGQLVGHNHAKHAVMLEPSIFSDIDGFATGLVGFHSADVDEPMEDMYSLAETCNIEAVLVSIDHGLVVHNGFQILAVGDSMGFGTPFFDYHPIFQIEDHHAEGELSLQFVFRDLNGVYSASEPMLMTFAALTAPFCAADFNQDGGVDGADVDVFFEHWETGLDEADVNGDGGVDGG